MKTLVLTTVALLGLGSGLWAQDAFRSESLRVLEREDEPRTDGFTENEADPDPVRLPKSLSEPFVPVEAADEGYSPFSLGASVGYLNVKDADHGTWFGGVQARLRMGIFAAEASVQFHQVKYNSGDVSVTQYPVQLTAFLYFLQGKIRPYILGGVGWYYTTVDYSGALSSNSNHTQNIFGEHLGAGGEFFLSTGISLSADVRYIFLNPKTENVINKEFNYWQINAGINFFF